MLTASPTQPGLLRPALAPHLERGRIEAGGALAFRLRAGESFVLRPDHAGEIFEICAFGPDGRPALEALGLAQSPDSWLPGHIADNAEPSAVRLRQRLFARGVTPGGLAAARLDDARLGRPFTAEKELTVVVGAPERRMSVWEQNAPGGVTLEITRSTLRLPFVPEPPEPLAEPRLDLVVDIASAQGFEVFAGEYIQIIDVAGRQCSDLVAFRRRALDAGVTLGLDSTMTRTMNGSAFPAPGLHGKFFDEARQPLVEVVQDTVGRHDTFNLACTARYYEDMGYFGHANCSDNFNAVLAPQGVAARKGWPALNLFFNTHVDDANAIWFDEPWSRAGDYVLLRALDDLVCAASSCPSDIDAANGWSLTPIHVRVYPRENLFRKATGYRMTAQSPMVLTRESGFHPKTSALTEHFTEYKNFWLPWTFRGLGAEAEYRACREAGAIMDLSALRKMEVVGPDAERFLQGMVTRDVRKLNPGQVVYTAMCYEHGGMVDDGTLFRLGPDNFRWIGGDDSSLLWLRENAEKSGLNVHLRDATDQIHNIAVQGPRARKILENLFWTGADRPTVAELGWFRFTLARLGGFDGIPVMISRTGYTGELGYEIFCHPRDAGAIWDAVMEAGAPLGLTPLGFHALDMLRIESGLVFGGHDFDSTTDPFEAGIGFAAPASKADDFVGRAALERRRATPSRKLVGLLIEGRETPSHGDPVFLGRAQLGVITSALRSPVLDKVVALARVDVAAAELGTKLQIGRLDGKLKRFDAEVIKFPFYDPDKSRVRA